jgi:hypothetical protein
MESIKQIMLMVGPVLLIASFAIAGAPKSYQATDLVLEFAGGHISVHKGNEKSFRGHLCFLIRGGG